MNNIILMGRLTRDPEVRYSNGENATAIARYSLAVDRRFKREGQPDADFFDCVCFGKSAEFAEKYLHKGTKMVIQGRLENDNYTDRDGKMVYRNRIVVESQEFAESKKASGENAAAASANAPAPKPAAAAPEVDANGFMNIPDDIDEELPFA